LKSNTKSSFINWFLPLFIILAPYGVGGSFSSYGIVILLIYTFTRLIFFKKEILVHKHILNFTVWVSFISVINAFRLDLFSMGFLNNLALPILFVVCLGVIVPNLNEKYFYKSYKIIGAIAMTIISYHSIRLFLFNVPAVPINILPVSPEDYHFWGYFKGKRPSGLFTEPQAFCSFIAPLLILANRRGEKIFGYLITISILLSTSSMGILFVALIYGYPIFNDKTKLYSKVAILLSGVFFIVLFNSLSIFEFSKDKLFEIDVLNNIRLSRGFVIYSNFDFIDFFLGIDKNTKSYVLENLKLDWVTHHVENDSEYLLGYLTSVAGTFVQFGFISGLLLLKLFFKLYKNEDKSFRLFLLVIVVLSFSQTLLFNAWFLFYYAIYLGLSDTKKYNSNYIVVK
tara:strand:- start:8246 stop:9439 length:1194 start_codon:yes stop_codon:yes gene_type:complete